MQSAASTANVPPNHHAILDHSAVFIWFINRKLIWSTWKISLKIVTISEINVIIIIVTIQSLFVLLSFNSSTWNIYWFPLQFSFKSFLRLFPGLCSTWNFFFILLDLFPSSIFSRLKSPSFDLLFSNKIFPGNDISDGLYCYWTNNLNNLVIRCSLIFSCIFF